MSNANDDRVSVLVRTGKDVFDQLMEWYRREWENTPCQGHGTNFRALSNILRSSGLSSVTNIVIHGLGNGGTRDEQLRNAEGTLNDDYLEYTQKVFFTQLAVASAIRRIIWEHFRVQVLIYAYDLGFSKHSRNCLEFMGFGLLTMNRDAMWWAWHDKGSLIYDVTKHPRMFDENIEMTWQGNWIQPAAILASATAVTGDNFDHNYYMLPMMQLEIQTASSSNERYQLGVSPYAHPRFRIREWLRERESRLTRTGYEQILVRHKAIMDDFARRVDQRASEIRRYYQTQLDQEGAQYADQYADQYARQSLLPFIPQDTNSYVYDPVMVLLCRKPQQT